MWLVYGFQILRKQYKNVYHMSSVSFYRKNNAQICFANLMHF